MFLIIMNFSDTFKLILFLIEKNYFFYFFLPIDYKIIDLKIKYLKFKLFINEII